MSVLGGYKLNYEQTGNMNVTIGHSNVRETLDRVRGTLMKVSDYITPAALAVGSALVGFSIAKQRYLVASLIGLVTFEIVRFLVGKLYVVEETQPVKKGGK